MDTMQLFKDAQMYVAVIKHYPVAYFNHVTMFEALYLLKAGLIHTVWTHEYLTHSQSAYKPMSPILAEVLNYGASKAVTWSENAME